MEKKTQQQSKKKRVVLIIAAIVLLAAAAVAAVFLFGGNRQKTVNVKVDTHYSELAKKENPSLSEVEKALKDYSKSENGNEITYIKGKETVKVKLDASGNIIYLSYNNALGENEQVKLSRFNESMIKIGDTESDVLALLAKDDYVYNLKTINDEGQALHIYYYGWKDSQAILELVFTDSKLTYYTLNSKDISTSSQAPELKDVIN